MHRLVAFFAFVAVGEALGSHDLLVDDAIAVVGPVRTVHHEFPDAAGTHLHRLRRRREAVRSPPVADVRGIAERVEHELAGRVDQSRDDDFAIGSDVGLRGRAWSFS
jgi:hypothetical protein